MQLLKSGMKPKVERGGSQGGQINVNLSFEMNTDAAKAYLEKARVQIQDAIDGFKGSIKDINEKLEYYHIRQADSKELSSLIKVFVAYYDYVCTAKIEIGKQTISFEISEEMKQTAELISSKF